MGEGKGEEEEIYLVAEVVPADLGQLKHKLTKIVTFLHTCTRATLHLQLAIVSLSLWPSLSPDMLSKSRNNSFCFHRG